MGGQPDGQGLCDFVFQYRKDEEVINFAVECKWRNSIPHDIGRNLFPADRLDIYQRFSTDRHASVFVLLGIGGEACEPEQLYIIPLDAITSVLANECPLSRFRRTSENAFFAIDEFAIAFQRKETKIQYLHFVCIDGILWPRRFSLIHTTVKR